MEHPKGTRENRLRQRRVVPRENSLCNVKAVQGGGEEAPRGMSMNNTKSAAVKFSIDNHSNDEKVWENSLPYFVC